jgi:Co/Zn/Cd efflux system component
MIHTLFPKLILMPYTYRNMAQRIVKALAQTVIGFLCFGLTWFSGTTGLSNISKTPILDWVALALTVYLIFVWLKIRKPLERSLQQQANVTGVRGLVAFITVAILLPFGLLYVHEHVQKLPKLYIEPDLFIPVICVLALIVSAAFFFLLFKRMNQIDPKTEVSELRDNWQESIHPQEIFINFESIVMANRRYKEVPNRVYREFDARLFEEGSNDKGHFKGEVIQETQPVFKEIPQDTGFSIVRTLLTITGHVLLTLAAFWLFRAVDSLEGLDALKKGSALDAMIMGSAGIIVMGMILWTFGSIMANFALAFWAEMQFESLLVYFKCQGTYTASKLSTGTSIYDSTRSENTVVRSSLTPWLIACRVMTCSFSGSGMKNLEYARHIIEMHKADEDLNTIVMEIREFIKSRQAIAGIGNDKDLESASQIFQINAQTRVGYAKAQAAGQIEGLKKMDALPGKDDEETI